MKIVVIDPYKKRVEEHEVPDVYPYVNQLLSEGMLTVCACYHDECAELMIGVAFQSTGAPAFRIEGGHCIYAGRAAVVGYCPENGTPADCVIPAQEVRDMVLWEGEYATVHEKAAS